MGDYEDCRMQELVGQTVTGLAVDTAATTLMITTTAGPFAWKTEADCCSETWFAEIVGVDALIGGTVARTERRELPWTDGKSRQEVDELYGIALFTEKGTATIIFRNSSNGYYGGSLARAAVKRNRSYRAITKDWSA